MSTLLELQRGFQARVLGDETGPTVPIAGTEAAPAGFRLRIYAEGIRLRFREVLGEDYPGLRGLLGDTAFGTLAGAYAQAHPSTDPSIRWFGRRLPDFLQASAPWRDRPVLAEMASFEWSKGELVDAADGVGVGVGVGVEDIAAVAPEAWAGIRPRVGAAARRLALRWNVPALWGAIDRGEAPPPPACGDSAMDWLLWRQDLVIRWRSIDADEAWALDACARGEDFGGICAGLCERVGADAAAFRAATLLKQWAADGLLASI